MIKIIYLLIFVNKRWASALSLKRPFTSYLFPATPSNPTPPKTPSLVFSAKPTTAPLRSSINIWTFYRSIVRCRRPPTATTPLNLEGPKASFRGLRYNHNPIFHARPLMFPYSELTEINFPKTGSKLKLCRLSKSLKLRKIRRLLHLWDIRLWAFINC